MALVKGHVLYIATGAPAPRTRPHLPRLFVLAVAESVLIVGDVSKVSLVLNIIMLPPMCPLSLIHI